MMKSLHLRCLLPKFQAVLLYLLVRTMQLLGLVMITIAIAILVGIFAANGYSADSSCPLPAPLNIDLVKKVGCRANKVVEPDRTTCRWHVQVYVEYQDESWQRLFAIRPANERSRALSDCDEWLTCFQKAAKDHSKER
jgi:hypothetical protein